MAPSSIGVPTGPNVTKLLTAIIYDCSQKVIMFVRGSPFQASIVFMGKR
jgi:hypothetical protein